MASVGIISTGDIGSTIGIVLKSLGHEILFASNGRSPKTINNATSYGFRDVQSMGEMAKNSDVVICIGMAHACIDSIDGILVGGSFNGLYIDLNSLHPEYDKLWRKRIIESGKSYCEGAFRGYPTHPELPDGSSHLILLSGPQADEAFQFMNCKHWNVQKSNYPAKIVNRLISFGQI